MASPVLIIPKPKKLPTDEPRFRFVIDYRAINEVIRHHGFRVNTCDSLWYTLDKAKYISTADAADGYWLAPLDKTTAYLTAFDAPDGRYEWTCLPMGIQPASGWFQSFMEDILAANNLLYTGEGNRKRNATTGQWENFVIVYQDDLIWFSENEADHHAMTELLLDTFSTEKLYLNPNKLNLCCKHTRYLGCIVGNDSLSMDPRKVDAVMMLAKPVDAGGVRQLLGMCQFYRRWIVDFANITVPLTDMLKKDVVWARDWGTTQDEAVSALKTAMSSYPVLRQHYPDKPNILLCDASTTGIGGMLGQVHDGHLMPVSYASHRLTSAESKYPITELEGLAILLTVRAHRHFLLGTNFTIRILSDHQPLQWVNSVATKSGRLTRWLMELVDYNFRIEFVPGRLNDVADAISRLQQAGPAEASQSIEFRDYLVESGVLTADVELLYADPAWAAEYDAAGVELEQLGGVDAHIAAALPPDWCQFLDPAGAEAFGVETVHHHALNLSQRCNSEAYLNCPSFAAAYRTAQHDRTSASRSADDLSTTTTDDQAAGDADTADQFAGDAVKPAAGDVQICAVCGKQWSCKKDPAEVHDMCRRCSAASQSAADSDIQAAGDVAKAAAADTDIQAAGDVAKPAAADTDIQAAGDVTALPAGDTDVPAAGDANPTNRSVTADGKTELPSIARPAVMPARMKVGMYVINGSLHTAAGRLCVPSDLRREVILEMHENDAVGHRGSDAMLHLLRARFYWPSMERDVRTVVSECDACGDSKASTTKHWGHLRPHLPPTRPFTHYSIDFMFGFPAQGGGPLQYDGIMVCVDMFSKRVIAIPVWEASPVAVVAEQFYRKVVCERGCILSIVSDRDSRFTSEFWRTLWGLNRTSLKMTPAYSPHADGQTERMNRVLEEIMRMNIQADQLNWLELLDGAVMAINNAPTASTGKSPFEMETGLSMRVPIDTQGVLDHSPLNRTDDNLARNAMEHDESGILLDAAPYPAVHERMAQMRYIYDHPARMTAIHQVAREQMVQAKLRMAAAENNGRHDASYQPGDFVRISLEHMQLPVWTVAKCHKLRGKYFGAFEVESVHSPVAIRVKLPGWLSANIHPVFHPMHLKPTTSAALDVGIRNRLSSVFEPEDYEVSGILAHRKRGPHTEFLVQWVGCSYLQSTWEPESGLAHAQRCLTAYMAKATKIEVAVVDALLMDPARLGRALD